MDARKLLRQKRAARSTQAKNTPPPPASKPNPIKPVPVPIERPEESEPATTAEPVNVTPGPDPDEALAEKEMEEFARFLAATDPAPETIPGTELNHTSNKANAVDDDDDDDETAGVEEDLEQQTISARVLSLRRKFDASSKVLKRSQNTSNISVKKLKPIASVVSRRNDDADPGEDSESDEEADAWRRKAF
ncbi:hypothetical protein HDU81_010752 [Chytriomyces hyalinus]|nr:hypothetical protein HDU81_010752 [Chytriomyces hyalinus]